MYYLQVQTKHFWLLLSICAGLWVFSLWLTAVIRLINLKSCFVLNEFYKHVKSNLYLFPYKLYTLWYRAFQIIFLLPLNVFQYRQRTELWETVLTKNKINIYFRTNTSTDSDSSEVRIFSRTAKNRHRV